MLLNSTLDKEFTAHATHHTFAFGEFVLNVDRGSLLKNGAEVHLRPKCFEVLTYFVRHQGVLISKKELLSAVWADVVVTEDSLAQCLIQIRKALGDRSKKMVRTVRGRGYLFDAPVTVHDPNESSAAAPAKTLISHRRPSVWSMAAIVVLSVAIAATWWNGGRQGTAGEDTAQAADSYSSRANEHNLKGRFFHSRRSPGDLERAIEQFERALAINPKLADAWVGLAGSIFVKAWDEGVAFKNIGEKFKFNLDRALELDPDHAEAHVRMASYYRTWGEFDTAQEHFDRALEHGQNNALVLSIAAGQAHSQSRLAEAINLQRRAVALDPLGAVNRGNLAAFLFDAGRLDESRVEFLNALDLNPEDADYINESLLKISILQNQFDEAESLVLQLPDGLSRDMGMAAIHYARGELTESSRIIERMSFDPSVEAAVRLAEIHANWAAFDESFQWLKLATERQLVAGLERRNRDFLKRTRHSPFLFPLHNDPRWKERLDIIERNIPSRPDLRFSLNSDRG
jgi:DNA-binding winged helix-turn-helix (wHTH) protein/Tfp pilus assembly protein PilF